MGKRITIQLRQAYLDNRTSALHFNSVNRVNSSTVEEFLAEEFWTKNNRFNTVTNGGVVQTTSSRRRSIGDIYKICKYYFPECTLQQVYDALYATIADGELSTSVCSTIEKRVYYNGGDRVYGGGLDEIGTQISRFAKKYDLDIINVGYAYVDSKREAILEFSETLKTTK